MIITILAEPRSGSTNFANWFFYDKRFTVLFNATDPKSKWYKKEGPESFFYKTKYLLIKEDFYVFKDYSNIIDKSDKIFFLFRENEKEQIQSWCNSVKTGNWDKEWIWKENNRLLSEELYFKELKNKFKEISANPKGMPISYEDLYERNKIEDVLNYLKIENLNAQIWPIGKKYRIFLDNIDKKLL